MSNLKQIAQRHGRDRWKDAAFIGAALLMTALAIGSVTAHGTAGTAAHEWTVTVVESTVELAR